MLGFDLGGNFGWSKLKLTEYGLVEPSESAAGQWDLSSNEVSRHARLQRGMAALVESVPAGGLLGIAFERARLAMMKSETWARLYYPQRLAIMCLAKRHAVQAFPIEVHEVKTRATGRGNAEKGDVMAFSSEVLGRMVASDHESDAVVVALCGVERWRDEQQRASR